MKLIIGEIMLIMFKFVVVKLLILFFGVYNVGTRSAQCFIHIEAMR